MRLAFVICLACSIAPSAFARSTFSGPRVTGPGDLTEPRPAPIRVLGADPNTIVEITTERRDPDSHATAILAAHATFRTDAHGDLDVSRARPIEGTYQGIEPLGLFWSAASRDTTANDPTPGPAVGPAPGNVRITVRARGKVIATLTTRSQPDPARLVTRTDTPFPGAIFIEPAGPGRHPVIIVLGGSEGGSSTARSFAPLFAARGYATLGLPYYNPGYDPTSLVPGLPSSFTEIPVDRLAAVRNWLATQPGADADRIGIWGASKGAEFALIAASRFGWIKAVAAIAASDLVWEGWGRRGPPASSFAFEGEPLAFQPYDGLDAELAKAAKGQRMDLRKVMDAGRNAFPARVAAARIPIERYRGALLVAGGGRDAIWPSAEMAINIGQSRRQAHLPTIVLAFPAAGHLLGGPGTTPARPLMEVGGEEIAIAHARAEVWDKTFALFDAALKSARPARRKAD